MAVPVEHEKTIERLERSARYLWAAQVADGRSTLDLGCGDGAGTSLLSAAGSSPILAVDPSRDAIRSAQRNHGDAARFEVAELGALAVPDGSFDLVTCFGALETSPDSDAVLDGIVRAVKPGGLLLASLAVSGEGEAAGSDPVEGLRRRFRAVEIHEQVHYAGTAIDWPPEGEVSARTAGSQAGARRSVLVAASDGALPALDSRASFEPIAGLQALLDSLSQWESRAREAEAEVAVMRWEVRIAGEKLVALVQRLVQLENAPTRRLRRLLRSKPARVSAADISKEAASDGEGISSKQE